MSKFEMTDEGYQAAKKWLEETDQLDKLEKEQSTDGYTLIALANHLFEKEKPAKIQNSGLFGVTPDKMPSKKQMKIIQETTLGKFANPLLTLGEEGVLQRVMVLSSNRDDVKSLRELLPFRSVLYYPDSRKYLWTLSGTYHGEPSWQVIKRLNAAAGDEATVELDALAVDFESGAFSMELIEKEEHIGGIPCRSFFVVIDSISDEKVKSAILTHGNYLGSRTTVDQGEYGVPELIVLYAIDVYPPKETQHDDDTKTNSASGS